MEGNSNVSNGKDKGKKKKQTFEEILSELDDIASVSKKKKPVVKVYTQIKDPITGLYETKPRKVCQNPRKKPVKQVKEGEGGSSATSVACSSRQSISEPMSLGNDANDETDTGFEITPEILQSLTNLDAQFPSSSSQTEWGRRKQNLEENWANFRNIMLRYLLQRESIPDDIGCSMCKCNVSVLRCTDCRQLLCRNCDNFAHKDQNHFHDREAWINGFYMPICNNKTVIDGKLLPTERPAPVTWPSPCPACKDATSMTRTCVDTKISIINTNGRFEFNDVIFRCTNCFGQFPGCTQLAMVCAGFWPASPQKSTTFYAKGLLDIWEELSNNSPGTSLASFIKSLERISKRSGRPKSINSTSFGKSFREWVALKDSVRYQTGEDRFVCPVCDKNCHSIHIDGHRKTYRFKKVPRGNEVSLYGDRFIANDGEVQAHMKTLYDKMGSQDYKDDKMCGASYWQAARSNSKKSFITLDETGLVVAGCRHVLALKAVNMFAGEQYGYALFLHKSLLDSLNMNFVWQDIMCKYWPWLERVVKKMPELGKLLNSSKALSVMHAKAHSLDCQLVWGGSYQDNAALSTGESMEQFFSYLAKCGLTTKNMNAAARMDTLTEHAAFWNERKIEALAASLAKQYTKTEEKMRILKKEKSNLVDAAGVRVEEKTIEDWESAFKGKATASFHRQNSTAVVNQLAEYFQLHQEMHSMPILESYVQSTEKACSIITGQEELFRTLSANSKSFQRKERRLVELENKLVSDHYEKNDALRDGKEILTQHTLELLRTRMIHTYLNIQQQKLEVSKLADTSKKRIKIRKAMSKNGNLLEATVVKYNSVRQLSTTNVYELDKNDVLLGKFAWQVDEVHGRVPVWLCKQIVDKNVLVKRCQEELDLLMKEMRVYVQYYVEKVQWNEEEIVELTKCLEDLKAGLNETDVAYGLQLKILKHQDKEDLYRHLAEGNVANTINGIVSLKRKGISLFKERLGLAAYWFKKAVGPSFMRTLSEIMAMVYEHDENDGKEGEMEEKEEEKEEGEEGEEEEDEREEDEGEEDEGEEDEGEEDEGEEDEEEEDNLDLRVN